MRVEVFSATNLSDKNLSNLKVLLEKKYDHDVQVETAIDPSDCGLKVKADQLLMVQLDLN